MKKKFTPLIVSAMLMLLTYGTAMGQWANVWGYDTLYFTADCEVGWLPGSPGVWSYSNTGNCDGLKITGTATHTWTRLGVPNKLDVGMNAGCSSFADLGNTRRYFTNISVSASTGLITYDDVTEKCVYDSYYSLYDWEFYTSNTDQTSTDIQSDGIYNSSYPSQHNHNGGYIKVDATGTYKSFVWGEPQPNWSHSFHVYLLYVDGSGNFFLNGPIDETLSGPGIVTPTSDEVIRGDIHTTGAIRLTGGDNYQFDGDGMTANLINDATKFFFDGSWDGDFVGGVTVSTTVPLALGKMKTVTDGQVLGFNGEYTGSEITMNGGVLALGEEADAVRKVAITSDSSVRVDAYNIEVEAAGLNPNDCVLLTSADVGYNQSYIKTIIKDSEFRITNSNWGCKSVMFGGSAFTPDFTDSESTGSLLIDPNVIVFGKGADIVNNNSSAPTIINSKRIDVSNDFHYEGTSAPLSIFFTHQNTNCSGCAYFLVMGDFIAENNGTSRISIKDEDGDEGYVKIDGNYSYTSNVPGIGSDTIDVSSKIEIGGKTTLDAHDDTVSFTSRDSWIAFGKGASDFFEFIGDKGVLNILAGGACNASGCDATPGSYVLFSGSASITNALLGTATIKSENDSVSMKAGIAYRGENGDLLIAGENLVDIDGSHDGSNLPTDIALGVAGAGNEGVYIYRVGTGNDAIVSGSGHVGVTNAFTYVRSALGNGGLSVFAGGYCYNSACAGDAGYVGLLGPVTTQNFGEGTVNITSAHHYVSMGNGFVHQGKNGDMTVKGFSYVDILNPYPSSATQNLPTSDITLPEKSGMTEGVYIERNGDGRDLIWSDSGHINVTAPFTYIQQSETQGNTNGLTLLADGPCKQLNVVCSSGNNFQDRGYIWLQNDVWTENDENGPVTIRSTGHYVRIGKDSRAQNYTGAHFTHLGVSGDLNILAEGACYSNACTSTEPPEMSLRDISIYNVEHDGRGYVWIGDDVKITMNGSAGSDPEGNVVIRSYNDIVNMDDSVTFISETGANLWVSGNLGVRTSGPTALENKVYDATGDGASDGTPSGYATTGQGFVTYLSENGYVDFGTAPNISDDTNFNTPFLYVAGAQENALLVEGHSRVFFGDSVTVRMDNVTSASPYGNAKIYSPSGWIKFADTASYSGMDGNLIIYAAGSTVGNRSFWNENLTCPAQSNGGFILFDSITEINYFGQGITWIRSDEDDVVMGDMFTYTSDRTASPSKAGKFIMQAGQDIYGKSFEDTLHFIQRGDSSILMESKKTIHLQQMLYIDREQALSGDITFKAGYTTFAEPTVSMTSHEASYSDDMPVAKLRKDALYWDAGECDNIYNYTGRFSSLDSRGAYPGSTYGGNIWFEGRVLLDLTKSEVTNNTINTTFRAYNAIYIDSTFIYQQNFGDGGDVLLYAEVGNIEAAATRQKDAYADGYVADDTVMFDIRNTEYTAEIRLQAGNQVWGEGYENGEPTSFASCWETGGAENAEYNGNILYNKPFIMNNKGKGNTILSAARDIESQVMAPFIFAYDGGHQLSGDLTVTAGRHIETHAKMRFDYPDDEDRANVTLEAGRLDTVTMKASALLCKTIEEGTTLSDGGTSAYDPEVETGGVNGAENNSFARGGKGHGSILLFDSLEFNYNGAGKTLLVAENGNIESDPYLHKDPDGPSNPGNNGLGYSNTTLEHDAQLTFNHGGSGVTQLKAIDIKLHDKIAYYATLSAVDTKNGQLYVTAYDSILTRNLQYVNHTDTGSVYITTSKYKSMACDAAPYDCLTGGPGIHQGHIVLGYGADCMNENVSDSIVFDYNSLGTNSSTEGGNIHILAGFEGFEKNRITGKLNNAELFKNDITGMDKGKNKGYGGNITFDYMAFYMPAGNGTSGGYTEIRTPNGNIWGKDSILYRGINGDFLVDAGLGSEDDLRAIRWDVSCIGGEARLLNTNVPDHCGDTSLWRTGNIMMKGATLNFGDPQSRTTGTGNAIFRTREGFIDTYDAFTVDSMSGNLLKYAGMENTTERRKNNWGDVSERDFSYTPVKESGSVFFGADDNIMLNYGNSNFYYSAYGNGLAGYPSGYDVTVTSIYKKLNDYSGSNPYYHTSYEGYIDNLCAATFDVNTDGYMFYRNDNYTPRRNSHLLYRGCQGSDCSGFTGDCKTTSNGARDLTFNFDEDASGAKIQSGGLAVVASNYIDMYTKFTY
ncbi:MAG: hypothetical protein LBG28_09385, partial [Tannerella sp.]|nr:hypothetical protein [Tannerella sp.]